MWIGVIAEQNKELPASLNWIWISNLLGRCKEKNKTI